MKRNLLIICLMAFSSFAIAQTGTIKGRILDPETNESLIGANAVISGTTQGATTDIDGYFTIENVEAGNVTINISFIGYSSINKTITVNVGQTTDMGEITLETNMIGLREVEVIASVAIDRKTPVAVSTIKAEFISEKIGSQEFPEILKSTPGVYATRAGGGFGDGRINIRGFESENVAVLINGVPVNDMENGRVYWSNWAGLTDATRTIQVQRGLGASKVAVPSIGGTINIISKASDFEKGGSIYVGTGNDAYSKIGFQVSSGLTDNGWAFTASASKTQGDGYVDGTEFLGFSYYANIAKQINDNHEVTFTVVGAKQRHGQRQNRSTVAAYEASASGIKYNPDWGYLNGQVLHAEDNFYHKPQMSLNHYWNINEKMDLSTAVYASFGTGGGGGRVGAFERKNDLLDFETAVDQNIANPTGESLSFLRASRNDHNWYGALSTLNYDLTETLSLIGGLDFRYYKGDHFSELSNLLGGEYIVDDNNVNNPNAILKVGDIRDYHNINEVLWEGLFGQLEYSKDKLSGFVTLNVSNTAYNRKDLFKYLDSDPLQKTDWVTFLGFGVKGGANYNLTDNHNVFFNAGYFEKAPFSNAVFLDFDNIINEDAENQKIFSYELGYGYRKSNLTANINVYRTEWKDRTLSYTVPHTLNPGTPQEEEVNAFANILGVGAVHQGIEMDLNYKLTNKLTVSGMLSLGDWTWKDNLKDVGIFYEQDKVDSVDLYIAGLKVGDAAQTTAAVGIDYKLMKNFKIGLDYNYYANYYARFSPEDRSSESDEGVDAYELPSYGLVDLSINYKFKIAGLNTSLFGNIYNIGNVEYFSDASDDGGTLGAGYYGAGTTWNLALRVNF